MHDKDSKDLKEIVETIKDKPIIENNPFSELPKESLEKVLDLLKEYGEEFHQDRS